MVGAARLGWIKGGHHSWRRWRRWGTRWGRGRRGPTAATKLQRDPTVLWQWDGWWPAMEGGEGQSDSGKKDTVRRLMCGDEGIRTCACVQTSER